jgi:hypothetical protein
VSQDLLNHDCFLFLSPQSILVLTIGPLSRWCLAIALSNKGSSRTSLRQGYPSTLEQSVSPNPHTGFKACGRCRFILQLGLPDCGQRHLAYLVITSFVPHAFPGIWG